eukprot:589376-Pyramimonas_sp.AAC.1
MSVRAKVVGSIHALPTASMGLFLAWDCFALSLALHFSSKWAWMGLSISFILPGLWLSFQSGNAWDYECLRALGLQVTSHELGLHHILLNSANGVKWGRFSLFAQVLEVSSSFLG